MNIKNTEKNITIISLLTKLTEQIILVIAGIPYFIEKILTYIISLLRIVSAFIADLYSLIQPIFALITPLVSHLFSYKFFLKISIYFGIASKTTLLLNTILPFSIPTVAMVLITEYSTLLNNSFFILKSVFLSIQELIYEYKNDVLNIKQLETQLSELKSTLDDKKEELSHATNEMSKKESALSAELHNAYADLDILRDKSSRFLVLNEQLQQELSKSKSVSSWNNFTSILSILVSTINALTSLHNMLSGNTNSFGMDDDTKVLLQTISETLKGLQSRNLEERAASRSTGETPQITGGTVTSFQELTEDT